MPATIMHTSQGPFNIVFPHHDKVVDKVDEAATPEKSRRLPV